MNGRLQPLVVGMLCVISHVAFPIPAAVPAGAVMAPMEHGWTFLFGGLIII